LRFNDKSIAIDLNGNAGITAKILGAVFGKESISNKNYVGIGLHFLDAGWTYDNLAGVALDAAVAAGKKATKEQMALLKQEKALQGAMYKTGNVALRVGDAIAALKAEGVDVPRYRLPSDSKLQQKLLEIQSRFEVMADTMPEPGDLAWFVLVCRP
jgi:hypothetical protein